MCNSKHGRATRGGRGGECPPNNFEVEKKTRKKEKKKEKRNCGLLDRRVSKVAVTMLLAG